MDFLVKINLLSLPSAEVIDREYDDGTISRGIFIPLEENLLKVTNKGRNANYWMRMMERLPNPYMLSHSVKPQVNMKDRERYIEMNGDIPYIGDVRIAKKLSKYLGKSQNLDDILKK